jgi:N-methylhydantoinase B
VNFALRQGDVFSMRTQGGGGYGPPEERSREAIEKDIREGKLSGNQKSSVDNVGDVAG